MKKIISILLVAVMVFTGYVSDFNVKAEETEEIVTSGTCGDDIRWEFNEETGILSLDGTGEMDDFKGDSEIPWSNFKYQIKDIKISKGITSIGTFAFRDIIYVDNLILPDGIEKIGNYAFCWSHFKNIQFPNTLAYIGNGAFECCMDLEVVDLFSTQVREIKKECFYNCRKLKLFVSPYELNKIEDFAFGCCQDLKYMDLNEQLTSIGEGAFHESGVEKIEFPDNVILGSYMFEDAVKLKEVKIGRGITNIPVGIFKGCIALEKVECSEKIQNIGWSAFSDCYRLESIDLSEVRSIESHAFQNCSRISDITIDNKNCYIDGMVFWKNTILHGACNSTLYEYAMSKGNPFESTDCDGKDVTYIVVKEPTYTSEGEYKNVCKRCGKEYYGKIEKLVRRDLTDKNIMIENKTAWEYTGNAIKPLAYIKGLAEGSEYNIVYSNNLTPGYAIITFEGLGKYIGKVYKLFKIIPQKLKIKKARRKNNKLTISWNKKPYISGVDIKYSTRKDMQKAKTVVQKKGTSKTFKKLKPKKPYYIQIRAYSIAGKEKIYGTWSKKVKVKKVKK